MKLGSFYVRVLLLLAMIIAAPVLAWQFQGESTSVRVLPGVAWSPNQATGEPDAVLTADDSRSWAPLLAKMGEQWLELSFTPPRFAHGVRIFEGNMGGALIKVIGYDILGAETELWSGTDPSTAPGECDLRFPLTGTMISRVRLVLNTDLTSGWDEIDAVQLAGPGGRSWATAASASSYYYK
jgi:hypothetical protein